MVFPSKEKLDQLLKLVKPKASSVKFQPLLPRKDVLAWTLPETAQDKERNTFPFASQRAKHTAFQQFLRLHEKSKNTRKMVMQAMGRFLSLFEDENGACVELDGALLNSYESGALTKVLAAPLFASERSWTRHFKNALRLWIKFQKGVLRKAGDKVAKDRLEELDEELFEPLDQRVAKASHTASVLKLTKDAKKLQAAAATDFSVVQDGVRQAMADLIVLGKEYIGKDMMPVRCRMIANRIMVGLLYANQFGGRAMEWQTMPRKRVQEELLQNKARFVETTKYKTGKYYGMCGKDVSEGSRKAMELYDALPGATYDTFLQIAPVCKKKKDDDADALAGGSEDDDDNVVSISQALKGFYKQYLPGHQPLTATLLRKWLTSTSEELGSKKEAVR